MKGDFKPSVPLRGTTLFELVCESGDIDFLKLMHVNGVLEEWEMKTEDFYNTRDTFYSSVRFGLPAVLYNTIIQKQEIIYNYILDNFNVIISVLIFTTVAESGNLELFRRIFQLPRSFEIDSFQYQFIAKSGNIGIFNLVRPLIKVEPHSEILEYACQGKNIEIIQSILSNPNSSFSYEKILNVLTPSDRSIFEIILNSYPGEKIELLNTLIRNKLVDLINSVYLNYPLSHFRDFSDSIRMCISFGGNPSSIELLGIYYYYL